MDYKGNKTFLFTWKIKNLWVHTCHIISSPSFVVEALDNTRWHLELDTGMDYADEYMCCHLLRDDDGSPGTVDLRFEISLTCVGENSSENVRESRFFFEKGDRFTFEEFALRESLFRKKLITFKITCRMWTNGKEFVGAAQCAARTLMTKKMVTSFQWTVEGISSLSVSPTKSFTLSSSSVEEESSTTLDISINLKSGAYRIGGINVDLRGWDSEKTLVICLKMSVLNAENKVVWSTSYSSQIIKTRGIHDIKWHIPFYVTRQKVAEYSPGDVLTSRWKCQKIVIDVNEIQYPNRRPIKLRK